MFSNLSFHNTIHKFLSRVTNGVYQRSSPFCICAQHIDNGKSQYAARPDTSPVIAPRYKLNATIHINEKRFTIVEYITNGKTCQSAIIIP